MVGSRRAVSRKHLAGEQGPDRAVDVAHRQRDLHRPTVLDRRPGEPDQLVVEVTGDRVLLGPHAAAREVAAGEDPWPQDRGEVQQARLRVAGVGRRDEPVGAADHLVHGAEAERGHLLAQVAREEAEEALDVLGRAAEALAQLGVLGRHADRAGVEVALAHHDAAERHEQDRAEAELLGASAAIAGRARCAAGRRPGRGCGRADRWRQATAAPRRGRAPRAARSA
jgi:hypothetical protein